MSPTAGVFIAGLGLSAGLSPNAVTMIGCALAIPIVVLNSSGELLWASAVLHLFYAIDCADGILARATRRTSRSGAFLDDLAHCIVPPAFFLSLAFWAMSQSLYALAVVAASFAVVELAYRNVIQTLKKLQDERSESPPRTNVIDDGTRLARVWSWLMSSFHLPTVSVFVTATMLWPEWLTAYLAYVSVATLLYLLYAAARVSSQLAQRT